ncbi:hypothetical protein [Streptomyces filamentosus]|uniref:hypothetical protein n=1 Tax=Streptomyces filamentosus TaxID=67294 RepID=UPI00340C9A62
MTKVRTITDHLEPLLMALGGLVAGRLALGLAAEHGTSPLWQAATAVLVYTLTVALLGRAGGDDPHQTVTEATRILAFVLLAALAGALQLLCTTVQFLALLGGGLAALASTRATT